MWLGFALYTWGKLQNPKHFKTKLGLSWNSAKNASDPIFD